MKKKNTKMIALASALCTAFTCSNASLSAVCITADPELAFEHEGIKMQVAFNDQNGKPYIAVTGFSEEAVKDEMNTSMLTIPAEIPINYIPIFDGREEYETIPVEVIAEKAFCGNKKLMHIDIPATITTIEDSAFDGCIHLSHVNIELCEDTQLTSIGAYAFFDCRELTNFEMPESLLKIDSCAFARCSELTEVTIPAESIGSEAFAFCTNLADVTILRSNASIPEYAFSNGAVLDPLVKEIVHEYLFYGTIHGYRGSTAQEYAEACKCNFAYLSELSKDAGDLDGDSAVTVADAQLALREYTIATVAGGQSTLTFAQRRNGDINRDGIVAVEDAQLILKYYVMNTLAGTPTSWETLLYGKLEVPDLPEPTPAVTTTTATVTPETTMPPVVTTAPAVQTTFAAAQTTAAASTKAPVMTTAAAK